MVALILLDNGRFRINEEEKKQNGTMEFALKPFEA